MKVQLEVVAGPYQGERFKAYVTSGVKTTIGRAPDNDIAFPATPTVSNHHAYLTNQNGVLVLIDNGSTNGLWVDGQRVTRWPVRDGGVVGLGRTGPQIRFTVGEMHAGAQSSEYAAPPAPFGASPAAAAAAAAPAAAPPAFGSPCPLCGTPIDHNSFTCFQCRRTLCASHYDPQAGVCRPCTTRPPAAAPAGFGFSAMGEAGTQEIGTACSACGSTDAAFFFTCPGCGRFQCSAHHNPQTGYCTSCSPPYPG